MTVKKFTIIASPINEALLIKSLGNSGLVHLEEVKGKEYDDLRKTSGINIDYIPLKNMVKKKSEILQEIVHIDENPVKITLKELKEFTQDPENKVNELTSEIDNIMIKLERAKEQEKVFATERKKIIEEKKKLNGIKKTPKCLGIGKVKPDLALDLFKQLDNVPGLRYRNQINSEDQYVYIFGHDSMTDLVEVIFNAYDVENVVKQIEENSVMFVFDHEKHKQLLEEYKWELIKLYLLLEDEADIAKLRDQIDNLHELIQLKTKNNFSGIIRKIKFQNTMLETLSCNGVPVLRTRLMSVLQGWIEEKKIETLNGKIEEIKKTTGEMLYVTFEKPSKEEKLVPTVLTRIRPSVFQPLASLTTLRGWPSVHEINPSMLNVFVFSLQFGLMFGDVGQGLTILLLGLIFCLRAKGLACKIGAVMIPMGLSSILFGFMYGEIFLISGIIKPILYSPIHHIGKFMRLILGVALLELLVGLGISASNHIKNREFLEALGQHGLGAILFVSGLYVSCMAYLGGLDMTMLFNYWSFNVMLTGLMLSALIPFISSLKSDSFSIEVLGEIVGALMMVMVESLSGFFSFLRIAAFAFAHGALGIATNVLSITLSPILGVIITNGIALTFEFVSSTIQSLRLLYHEFMGKFFIGDGVNFRPFRLKFASPQILLVDSETIITELEEIAHVVHADAELKE